MYSPIDVGTFAGDRFLVEVFVESVLDGVDNIVPCAVVVQQAAEIRRHQCRQSELDIRFLNGYDGHAALSTMRRSSPSDSRE